MIQLFFQGNVIFMGILTILLIIIIAIAIYQALQISKNNVEHQTTFRHRLTRIKSVGIFALVFGFLCQLLGLYQMFSVIAESGAISPEIIAGGIKVTAISSIYGIIIFLIAYIIWLTLDRRLTKA